MTRPWRLTRRAEQSLIEIADWTYETFGPRQALAYESDLIERCEAIAAGRAQSQECSALVGEGVGKGLRYARAGEHFVVFLDQGDSIVIVDFLHARSDLPRRIALAQVLQGG